MSGTKRLAKRSIVGTRVSALWQDGRFYPGVIRAQVAEETTLSPATYTIHFDDGFEADVPTSHVIGPGFQTGPLVRLKKAQRVYVTMNGREVSGLVVYHNRESDEVIITVKHGNTEDVNICRRLEDVRLLESRKSARLVDQDTDYSKLADLQLSEPKRRAVSHNIDVPAQAFKQQRQRRHRDSSGDTEGSSEHGGNFDDVEMMDETIAAMVLTSLSVSPKSPTFASNYRGDQQLESSQELQACISSSVASSGFYSGHSERDDPSPPHMGGSAPASFEFQVRSDAVLDTDNTSMLDSNISGKEEEKVKYRCTWRGCATMCLSTNDIERHIRRTHFDRDSDEELSEAEEEFYYTEVEDDMDSVTHSFAHMYTSTPPSLPLEKLEMAQTFDHDYQRKEEQQKIHQQASSVPSGGSSGFLGTSTSLPITIPDGQIKRSLSWQIQSPVPGNLVSPPQRSTPRLTPQERLQQHQAQSPKSHMLLSPLKTAGAHRKPRSEVRKCRKVYGMENRDQWCTQCKWKKACTRFLD